MSVLPRRLRHGEEATLVEHLGELRARLIVTIGALVVGFAVAYAFHGRILNWLNEPLPAHLRKPVTFSPIEPFATSIMVSLWAGLLLALPIVLWQLWAFLAPALEERKQRSILVPVAFATILGLGGVLFGYFVILIVALLVFGPKRLPEIGRSLGKGMREFKDSISGSQDDEKAELPARSTDEAPPPSSP